MNPDMTTRDRFKQAKFGMMETTRPNILLITSHDSGRHFDRYDVPTAADLPDAVAEYRRRRSAHAACTAPREDGENEPKPAKDSALTS